MMLNRRMRLSPWQKTQLCVCFFFGLALYFYPCVCLWHKVLLAVCINVVSESSQVDGDMIPHMVTFGYLRESPNVRVAYRCRSRRSSQGWSEVKPQCWWLISWQVVAPAGASSLLPLFLIYTKHTHTLDVLAYLLGARARSPTAQLLCLFPLFISS